MKKTVQIPFISILLMLLFSGGTYAQSLYLKGYFGEKLLASGDEVEVFAGPNTMDEFECKILMKNESNTPIDVFVRKVEVSVLPNTSNFFCFQSCYTPETFETDKGVKLEKGQEEEFAGHYKFIHENEPQYGVSIVRYEFFAKDNAFEPITVLVKYNLKPGFDDRSISLYTADNDQIETGASVYVKCNKDEPKSEIKINVKNVTSQKINVKVTAKITGVVEGALNSFQWAGGTFPQDVTVSSTHSEINGGDFSTEPLTSIYEHNGNEGIFKVEYRFHNEERPEDYTSTVVWFGLMDVPVGFADATGASFNSELIQLAAGVDADELKVNIELKNNASRQFSYRVIKEVVSEVSGTENDFSWGGNTVSGDTAKYEKVKGGDVIAFEGRYRPNAKEGTTVIKYHFNCMVNHIFFNTTFTVEYRCGSDGLETVEVFKEIKAYPIPADERMILAYSWNKEIPAEVEVINILGESVLRKVMPFGDHNLEINTSALQNGVYFYAIKVNNEIILSRKFIVAH